MFDNFIKLFEALKSAGIEDPLRETLFFYDILLKRSISNVDASEFGNLTVSIDELVRKRKDGVPREYIIGMAPFMGEMFFCSPDTLIPREETELLASIALKYINEKSKKNNDQVVIDMGTGCANIAVSLALNSENAKILASDLNPETIEIAQKNVDKFGMSKRVSLFTGDLFTPLYGQNYDKKIDIVVCNPPYIPTGSLQKMSPEVIDHEPKEAFDAGAFGIDFYRRLINESTSFLKPDGILVFEIGAGQEKLVTRLLKKNKHYDNIKYFDDGVDIRAISAVHSVADEMI